MNKFTTLVTDILGVLSTAPQTNENIVLQAEMRIYLKRAAYMPADGESTLFDQLGVTLYRYLPPPTAAPWAAQISALVQAE
jgi:hypothetical protein